MSADKKKKTKAKTNVKLILGAKQFLEDRMCNQSSYKNVIHKQGQGLCVQVVLKTPAYHKAVFL